MLYTDHMRIDPAYREALRACELDRVESVLARIEGRVAAWSRTTDTLFVASPDGAPGFYLKRYYYANLRLAAAHRLQGKLGQAEVTLVGLLRYYPADVGLLGELALVELAQGDEDRAAHLFGEVLKLDSENVVATAELARLGVRGTPR